MAEPSSLLLSSLRASEAKCRLTCVVNMGTLDRLATRLQLVRSPAGQWLQQFGEAARSRENSGPMRLVTERAAGLRCKHRQQHCGCVVHDRLPSNLGNIAACSNSPIIRNMPISQGVVKYFHPGRARHPLEHLLHLRVVLVLDLQAATEVSRGRQMGANDSSGRQCRISHKLLHALPSAAPVITMSAHLLLILPVQASPTGEVDKLKAMLFQVEGLAHAAQICHCHLQIQETLLSILVLCSNAVGSGQCSPVQQTTMTW